MNKWKQVVFQVKTNIEISSDPMLNGVAAVTVPSDNVVEAIVQGDNFIMIDSFISIIDNFSSWELSSFVVVCGKGAEYDMFPDNRSYLELAIFFTDELSFFRVFTTAIQT